MRRTRPTFASMPRRPCPVYGQMIVAPEANRLLVLQRLNFVVEGDAPALRTCVRCEPALPDESRSSHHSPGSSLDRFSAAHSGLGPAVSGSSPESLRTVRVCVPLIRAPVKRLITHSYRSLLTFHICRVRPRN